MKLLFTLRETECHMDKANLISLQKVTAVNHTRHHHGSVSVELTRNDDVARSRRWEENVCVCTKAELSRHLKLKYLHHGINMLSRNMEERTNRENVYINLEISCHGK